MDEPDSETLNWNSVGLLPLFKHGAITNPS